MSKTEVIKVRVTPEQRRRMERIVSRSGIGDLSDHIRKAIDEYADQNDVEESSPDSRAAFPRLSPEDEDDGD